MLCVWVGWGGAVCNDTLVSDINMAHIRCQFHILIFHHYTCSISGHKNDDNCRVNYCHFCIFPEIVSFTRLCIVTLAG